MEIATTIYLVRHAHADWQRDEARPLSQSGLEAAQAVVTLLSELPITAIYSSPFRRSVETVTPLADRLGLALELMPDLRERELPIVPAENFDRVVQDMWRFPDRAVRGAESNAAAQVRALSVVRRVVTQHSGQHVVVATHGSTTHRSMQRCSPSQPPTSETASPTDRCHVPSVETA